MVWLGLLWLWIVAAGIVVPYLTVAKWKKYLEDTDR